MDCEEYNKELWGWQDECCLREDAKNDISHCIWDEVNNGEDDLLFMLEHTPVKECSDFGYLVSDNGGDKLNNGTEESAESSQLKRRRMLQFNSDDTDSISIELSSAFVKSKIGEDSLTEDGINNENMQWVSGFLDGQNGLDQSSERWLASCFNESEMQFSSDEMNASGFSDDHAENSERCNIATQKETVRVSATISTTPCSKFKGKRSCIRAPTKMTSAVAYPFALIKPCGAQGDLTLKDINQRIHDPGLSKTKQSKNEDSSYCYSAFSGKPVVVKTKIRTDGGKGSITIMRTKG